MKQRLNEIYVSKLEVKKSSEARPGVLCTVQGPFAEYGVVNRNNRLYTSKVWEKAIKSQSIQEGLRNKTLFGEADHPHEDRYDPTLPLVSHSITKLWIEGEKREGAGLRRS